MPVYTYKCDHCGAEFDAFASIAKKESGWQPQCPRCGSDRTRQVFKAVPLVARSPQAPPRGSCCSK